MFSNVPNITELLDGMQTAIDSQDFPSAPSSVQAGGTAIAMLNEVFSNIPGMPVIPPVPLVPDIPSLPVTLPVLPALPRAGNIIKLPFV